MLQSEKNKMISDAKKAILGRREYQDCKTFKFKVDHKDKAGTVYTSKPDRKIKFFKPISYKAGKYNAKDVVLVHN